MEKILDLYFIMTRTGCESEWRGWQDEVRQQKAEPGKFRLVSNEPGEEEDGKGNEGERNGNNKNNEHGINWILFAGEAKTVQFVAHWHFKAGGMELNVPSIWY